MRFEAQRDEYVPDPDPAGFYEIKTWWRSFQDDEDWARSAALAAAPDSPAPRGLLAAPSQLEVHEVFIELPASGNL